MLGIGAMIQHLSGDQGESFDKFKGRRIASASFNNHEGPDGRIVLRFDDGSGLAIEDRGRSCCENRYITTDDDLSTLASGRLLRIEAKDGPDQPDEYGSHETCFVEIATDQGFVTLTTHNEHNGYYGGFWLKLVELPTAPAVQP